MEFLRPYQLEITLGIAFVVLIQFLLLLGTRARLSKISRMMRSLFAGPEGADLEAVLKRCLAQSRSAVEKGEELDELLHELALEMRGCIQHFGLVRYDAFGDVSGQQSFSLALLDADRNGAVISGLFSRADSRCYGKAVIAGTPEQTLSEEEQRALNTALSSDVSAPFEAAPTNSRGRVIRR